MLERWFKTTHKFYKVYKTTHKFYKVYKTTHKFYKVYKEVYKETLSQMLQNNTVQNISMNM